MSELTTLGDYGVLIEPATLKMQRRLPGPIERVWAYLTKSELRRQWLASGEMELKVDAPFEFVWRNDDLTDPPGQRPPDFPDEYRMQCRIIEVRAPNRLVFSWGSDSEVSFELEQQGDDVLLSMTHRRVPDRSVLLNISAGWHAHLDLLSARLNDRAPLPHWDHWSRLKQEYAQQIPG